MAIPRGIRNNNPGNIEHNAANQWQGRAPDQTDSRFVQFAAPAWGVRAMAVLLIRYYDKYHLDTIRKVISRWAPSNENNTLAYVRSVCKFMGRDADEHVNLHDYHDLQPLVRAIIAHENGAPPKGRKEWYGPEVVDEGLRRAGVIPSGVDVPKRRLDAEATSTATGAAGAVGSAGVIAYLAAELREANQSLRDHGKETGDVAYLVAPPIVTLLACAAVFYFWRKRKRAERL